MAKSNPNIKGVGVQQKFTPKQLTEYIKCSEDPIYFVKNYVKIVNLDEGFIPFELYPYQERLIETFNNNRFVIAKIGRQSGKTVTCVSYLLWCILFNNDYSVAILANKGKTALEILQRLQRSYEALPNWLQQGTAEYNKGSMKLENGSRIVASTSSADSIRGDSFNCIGSESNITVMIGDEIRETTIGELFNEDVSNIHNDGRETITLEKAKVLTQEGWKKFHGIVKTHNQNVIKLIDSNLVCTPDHKILHNGEWIESRELNHAEAPIQDVYDLLEVEDTHSFIANDIIVHNCVFLDEFAFVPDNIAEEFMRGVYPTISSGKTSKIFIVSTPNGLNHYYKEWKRAEDKKSDYVPFLVHWSEVPGRDEKWKAAQIRNGSAEQFAQEFETEFLGSADTLISPMFLRQLVEQEPIYSKNNLDIFVNPQPNKKYFISVDVGKGRGLDYSVFNVLDVTDYPYSQVAKFRSNDISHLLLPSEVERVARAYNNAMVLVELNDVGTEVANILYQDLEYENIFTVRAAGNRYDLGLTQTKKSKQIGCSNIKDLVETHKLIINDFTTITEMSTFVKKRKLSGNFSYEADAGSHDDLMMSLVNFAWAVQQPQFKEQMDQNLRERMLAERGTAMEDQSLSFMFENNGIDDGYLGFGESSGDIDAEQEFNDWFMSRF